MSDSDFKATHRIHVSPSVEVMLDTLSPLGYGPAYQRCEWETTTPADYEYNPNGWTFQGQAFTGRVEELHTGRAQVGELSIWVEALKACSIRDTGDVECWVDATLRVCWESDTTTGCALVTIAATPGATDWHPENEGAIILQTLLGSRTDSATRIDCNTAGDPIRLAFPEACETLGQTAYQMALEPVKISARRLADLARITTRDESGTHFSQVYDDAVELLERLQLIRIHRPIHATGIPYGQELWTVGVTELGQDLLATRYDASSYGDILPAGYCEDCGRAMETTHGICRPCDTIDD